MEVLDRTLSHSRDNLSAFGPYFTCNMFPLERHWWVITGETGFWVPLGNRVPTKPVQTQSSTFTGWWWRRGGSIMEEVTPPTFNKDWMGKSFFQLCMYLTNESILSIIIINYYLTIWVYLSIGIHLMWLL